MSVVVPPIGAAMGNKRPPRKALEARSALKRRGPRRQHEACDDKSARSAMQRLGSDRKARGCVHDEEERPSSREIAAVPVNGRRRQSHARGAHEGGDG